MRGSCAADSRERPTMTPAVIVLIGFLIVAFVVVYFEVRR